MCLVHEWGLGAFDLMAIADKFFMSQLCSRELQFPIKWFACMEIV